MDCSTSKVGLLVSIAGFVYLLMFSLYDTLQYSKTPRAQWVHKMLEGYAHFFIIGRINVAIQLFSLLLHMAGPLSSIKKTRDFVFANLALPLSISTMASFWIFWFLVWKSNVFLNDWSAIIPLWLTLGFHTLSPIANIILLTTDKHEYSTNPFMFSYCFMGVYLFGAFTMYFRRGNLNDVFMKKFTNYETAIYYFAFCIFNHIFYICGYVYNDMYNSERDYEKIVKERLAEAEKEINSAPSPISRTPTPLLIIPRESPSLLLTTTAQQKEDSPEIMIPSAYRPKPVPGPSSGSSTSGPMFGKRRGDKKNI